MCVRLMPRLARFPEADAVVGGAPGGNCRAGSEPKNGGRHHVAQLLDRLRISQGGAAAEFALPRFDGAEGARPANVAGIAVGGDWRAARMCCGESTARWVWTSGLRTRNKSPWPFLRKSRPSWPAVPAVRCVRRKGQSMRRPPDSPNAPGNARIALILLAAGASTRLGRPKQLLGFRGRSLLRHAAETALASVCRPVVVVLGALADRLQTELTALPVTVALNPAWAEGMAKSIRAGLKEVSSKTPGPDAVVIMLCDQPLITAGMLDQLVSMHRSSGMGIVASE